MLQARRLGTDLLVGIHSDEDILLNKGPTVMSLKERFVALFWRRAAELTLGFEACLLLMLVAGLPYLCHMRLMLQLYPGSPTTVAVLLFTEMISRPTAMGRIATAMSNRLAGSS